MQDLTFTSKPNENFKIDILHVAQAKFIYTLIEWMTYHMLWV